MEFNPKITLLHILCSKTFHLALSVNFCLHGTICKINTLSLYLLNHFRRNTYACPWAHTYTHTHKHMHTHMNAGVCVCVCVCVHMHVGPHVPVTHRGSVEDFFSLDFCLWSRLKILLHCDLQIFHPVIRLPSTVTSAAAPDGGEHMVPL